MSFIERVASATGTESPMAPVRLSFTLPPETVSSSITTFLPGSDAGGGLLSGAGSPVGLGDDPPLSESPAIRAPKLLRLRPRSNVISGASTRTFSMTIVFERREEGFNLISIVPTSNRLSVLNPFGLPMCSPVSRT